MVVECSNCKARFRFDPQKIGSKSVRVRCAKCKSVFTVAPSAPSANTEPIPPPAPPEPQQPPGENQSDVFSHDMVEQTFNEEPPNSEPQSEASSEVVGESPQQQTDEEGHSEDGPSEEDLWAALDDKRSANAPSTSSPPPIPEAPAAEISATTENPPETTTEEPAKPKLPPNRRGKPLLIHQVPLTQTLVRNVVVTIIMLVGITLGFVAMGVTPTPGNLKQLFVYGLKNTSPGLHVVSYKGRISHATPQKPLLRVIGEIYNSTEEESSPPEIRLEVFSDSGEFLVRRSAPCCEANLKPDQVTKFDIEVNLPTTEIGRYKVSLLSKKDS